MKHCTYLTETRDRDTSPPALFHPFESVGVNKRLTRSAHPFLFCATLALLLDLEENLHPSLA
jgi:hypothetical protein